MKRRAFTIGVGLLTVRGAIASTPPPDLLSMLRHRQNDVTCVSVTHIVDNLMTDIAIGPNHVDDFPGAYHKKTKAELVVKTAVGSALASQPRAYGSFADLRWSITFLDRHDNEIEKLYLAGLQNDGYINGVPVAYEDDTLKSFLRSYFDVKIKTN